MSIRTTRSEIRSYVKQGYAKDITYMKAEDIKEIHKNENYFDEVAYSMGTYGVNGLLLKGHNTGNMYAITNRTTAIYLV